MAELLIEPFASSFMQRALLAGCLAAVTASLVGVWVVLRGSAFIGDALAHGVLPGIAAAVLLNLPPRAGAMLGALVVVAGVSIVMRSGAVREDTAIGLLFAGMLAAGVILMSLTPGYVANLNAILFGSILGVTVSDLQLQAAVLIVVAIATVVLYRPFMALTFHPLKAQALGMFPRIAHAMMLLLVALAVVASFTAVGTLLVFALLVAPPATALLTGRSVRGVMLIAMLIGIVASVAGLLVSYHVGAAAAGASIAAVSVAIFFVALTLRSIWVHWGTRRSLRA